MTPRPTHLLRHEHRVIEQALRALDGMCLQLKMGQPLPATALEQLVLFIRYFADQFHHQREEDYLFPALQQAGLGAEGGALNFLHTEHLHERELLAQLELAIDEYLGGNLAAGAQIRETAGRYGQHLLAHMQKEDTLLFRLAEDMLEAEAKHELMRELAQSLQAHAAAVRKYEQLAADLERAWAV